LSYSSSFFKVKKLQQKMSSTTLTNTNNTNTISTSILPPVKLLSNVNSAVAIAAANAAAAAATAAAQSSSASTTTSTIQQQLSMTNKIINVRVQSSVVVSILDAYLRRSQGNERIVGTLLGSIQNKILTIGHCFTVPSKENISDEAGREVALGKEHHRQMKALHVKSSPQEVVVGMFAISNNIPIDGRLCIILDFYRMEVNDPLFLQVDISKPGNTISTFTSKVLMLNGIKVSTEFIPIPVEVLAPPPQMFALNLITQDTIQLGNSADALDVSVDRLLSLLEQLSKYVDDIVEGRVAPNVPLGKKLQDILHSVPSIPSDGAFSSSINDLVMISYLTQLVRAQLVIAEKLGGVL
jgi:translation initiation factor 3 subunit F